MKILLSSIKDAALHRPEGYYEDVISHGTVGDKYVEMDFASYRTLVMKYNPSQSMAPKCCGHPVEPFVPSMPTGSFLPPPHFPPMGKQIANAVGAAGRVAGALLSGGQVKAEESVVTERQTICNGCDSNKNGRCLHCGCYWKVKMTLATEKCPIGKW